jgi:hypothetical protein
MRRTRRQYGHGRGLTGLQAAYLLALLDGRTRRGAALAAGYSRTSAESVAEKVEGKGRGRFSTMRRFIELINDDGEN